MASEFLKFAIRGFKTGEALEAVVEQTMDSLMQQSAAPPQPDPAQEMQAQADQTKAQAEVIKAEAGVQKAGIDMQKANIEAQALPFKLLDSTGYSNAQDMTEGGL
jgi:hypothetical protein